MASPARPSSALPSQAAEAAEDEDSISSSGAEEDQEVGLPPYKNSNTSTNNNTNNAGPSSPRVTLNSSHIADDQQDDSERLVVHIQKFCQKLNPYALLNLLLGCDDLGDCPVWRGLCEERIQRGESPFYASVQVYRLACSLWRIRITRALLAEQANHKVTSNQANHRAAYYGASSPHGTAPGGGPSSADPANVLRGPWCIDDSRHHFVPIKILSRHLHPSVAEVEIIVEIVVTFLARVFFCGSCFRILNSFRRELPN